MKLPLHLFIVSEEFQPHHHNVQDDSPYRFGSDFVWNENFTAYRCKPIKWRDDASYLAYQAGDLDLEADDATFMAQHAEPWYTPEDEERMSGRSEEHEKPSLDDCPF